MMKIHQELKAGKYPSAGKLGQKLSVHEKTIRRDIEFMQSRLDLPIEIDVRRKGYFYTRKVESFPTLQITEGELLALVVAEKALRQLRGTPFEKPLKSAIKKCCNRCPTPFRSAWRIGTRRSLFTMPTK